MTAPPHLVVFTGSGISAESGIKTFRASDGLWEDHPIEEVATPAGWRRDPQRVLEFYNLRREQIRKAKPNAAHKALAALEKDGFKVSVAIVDHSGLLKVQMKSDGAGPHTLDSSFRKAYTSNSLRGSTQRFAVLTVNNPELRALGQMNEKILLLGGGFPITMNDEVVGGVGVGGAPGIEHDEVCAEAALKVLNPE